MKEHPESVNILQECVDLQLKKAEDYQNPNSSVVQADYYPDGVKTIHDILHAKMLRAKSLIEKYQQNPEEDPNFESLEDTFKDIINYSSFAASWCRCGIPGQGEVDILNQPISWVELGEPENEMLRVQIVREKLSQLPDRFMFRGAALNYLDPKYILSDPCGIFDDYEPNSTEDINFAGTMLAAFDWGTTAEGEEYWNRVSTQLFKLDQRIAEVMDQLSQLPEEYAKRAMRNFDTAHFVSKINDKSESVNLTPAIALNMAFVWDTSPEGSGYWLEAWRAANYAMYAG